MRGPPYAVCLAVVLALVSVSGAAPRDDRYLAGYVAAVLERELGLPGDAALVQDGVVTIDRRRLGDAAVGDVVRRLSAIDGVTRVVVAEGDAVQASAAAPAEEGVVLFPRSAFAPLVADPRWPRFSAAYQSYLGSGGLDDVTAVSLGESLPIVGGPGPGGGRWDLGLQGAVFSIFDLDSPSFDLVNSDFFVAVASGWRRGRWSLLGRVFHQSSHLGDEFLLRHRVNRVNLSYEGLDLLGAVDVGGVARLYGGGGALIRTEPDLDPGSAQLGLELRAPWSLARLRPVAAVDVQARQATAWDVQHSVRAGVEIASERLPRRLRVMLQYFDGRSPNGQFFRRDVEYAGIGADLDF
jgi:hypothetical protein